MTQFELNRALSRATGESRRRLRKMGFVLLTLPSRGLRKLSRQPREQHTARHAVPHPSASNSE